MSEPAAVSVALAIPDPRNQPVPTGWSEKAVLPVVMATEDWGALDEYEARLRAFASYVDSFSGDALEFEKALRIVEKRRGDLLGAEPRQGKQLSSSVKEVAESEPTQRRWRIIARHWDELWPLIREARSRSEVTQAAVLRVVEGKRMDVHYSSERDDWSTPQDLFEALDAEFHFDVDVCATPASAKCATYFTKETDGLAHDWRGSCWMNPPYGDEIAKWIQKAWESSKNATVVCLVPARVDTGWWWDYCRRGDVRFLKGRLRFGGGETGAPFPSAVVVFPGNGHTLYWERG